MKKLSQSFIFIFLSVYSTFAQKYDYTWLVRGNDSTSQVSFLTEPLVVSSIVNALNISSTHAQYSDNNGLLKLYSDGIRIFNGFNLLVENGDSLNQEFTETSNYSYIPEYYGAYFLPKPGDTSLIYLLYVSTELFTSPTSFPITKIQYALVDMHENSGLGKVIEKEIPIISGDLQLNFNHAGTVRHANGRDWWILVPHNMEPKYYRILLNPEGFSEPQVQEIGFKEPTDDPNYYFGVNAFSQDGVWYADYDFRTGVQVFNFDRCTGLLSRPRLIEHELDFTGIGDADIAFSPSSSLLYRTYAKDFRIWLSQYDLNTPDISASEGIVFDCSYSAPYDCSIGRLILAPNDKIYVTSIVDTSKWHIIHKPDSLGLACEFEFGGLEFPNKLPNSLPPYFPNYRLYDMPGSECDTLGIDAPTAINEKNKPPVSFLEIYPNPARGVIYINQKNKSIYPIEFQLYDIYGQLIGIWDLPVNVSEHSIFLNDIPAGIYFWRAEMEGDKLWDAGKLIVVE